MAEWAKLIESVAGLVTAVAWPVAAVTVVRLLFSRHRAAVERLLDRIQAVSYPGGQIDLAITEADQRAQVAELAERLAAPETDAASRRQLARHAVEQAEHLGRLREATWWGAKYLEDSTPSRRVRQAIGTALGRRS
ncbi:hypothetical protein ACIBO5_56400 [Nonomuraea angiospora]|uniref:hypothetical protein n=1 Tax=Nonomuraea angiospora TaxID=46172 RepID=UPI0037990BD8